MTYIKNGKVYESREGSRVQVARGKAYQTKGGLTARDIVFNAKTGRYVSRKKHEWGKRHGKKRLADAGYALFTPGAPGVVRGVTGRRRPARRA